MTGQAGAPLKPTWASLLFSMLVVLGVSYVMRPRMSQQDGLGVLTWTSVSWCVLSVLTGLFLLNISGEAKEPAKQRGLRIAAMATLESGALFAAVVHLVSPLDFGIYAALLPFGAMLASFPRD